jgi:hypothetical protein
VFVRAPADTRFHFFVMSFNSKGNVVTFVDPPSALVNSLGLFIRAVFPRRIVKEHISDDGVFTITLNPGINGTLYLLLYTVFILSSNDDGGGGVFLAMGPEKNHFLAHILRYINLMAFKLDASVPLARCGPFGLGGRKEIWLFKGSESLWSDSK